MIWQKAFMVWVLYHNIRGPYISDCETIIRLFDDKNTAYRVLKEKYVDSKIDDNCLMKCSKELVDKLKVFGFSEVAAHAIWSMQPKSILENNSKEFEGRVLNHFATWSDDHVIWIHETDGMWVETPEGDMIAINAGKSSPVKYMLEAIFELELDTTNKNPKFLDQDPLNVEELFSELISESDLLNLKVMDMDHLDNEYVAWEVKEHKIE